MMIRILSAVVIAALTSGCFSCSRHVATVRPETVKAERMERRYRLNTLTLPKGDSERAKKNVEESLLKNYPQMFTNDSGAIPVDVSVGWNAIFQTRPVLQNLVSYVFAPSIAEEETVFEVSVRFTEGGGLRSTIAHVSRYSETWETGLLPICLIPIPGKSDFPRTYDFCGLSNGGSVKFERKDSRLAEATTLIYDAKVDGEVIAAAIVRCLNRLNRKQAAYEPKGVSK